MTSHEGAVERTLLRARARQLATVVRRETVGVLLRWRGAWIYLLAFAPVLIISLHALQEPEAGHPLDGETTVFAGIVHFFYLRLAIFFAAAALFGRAFRGEIVERTLHYSLLAPIRRELLVLGKFLGNLVVLVVVFETAVVAGFLTMHGHFAAGQVFLREGPGLTQLGGYMLATLLACIGYGAIFLVVGLLFRLTLLPMLVVFGLETWSGVLPPALQYLTVTYYVKPICPMPPQFDGFAALLTVVVEPTPAWLAVGGLVVFAALVLVLATLKVKRMEINYTTD